MSIKLHQQLGDRVLLLLVSAHIGMEEGCGPETSPSWEDSQEGLVGVQVVGHLVLLHLFESGGDEFVETATGGTRSVLVQLNGVLHGDKKKALC